MFREMIRKKQALTKEECESILDNERRGVLSVNGDDGYPYCMPLNHFYNREDGFIYFHQGRMGYRLDALKKDDKVCYCVCDKGSAIEGKWAQMVKSVVAFGRIEIIDDLEIVKEIARKLSYKFTSDEKYISDEIEKYAKATILLKLKIEHLSGKRVIEE